VTRNNDPILIVEDDLGSTSVSLALAREGFAA
jgi:hypothetical protein